MNSEPTGATPDGGQQPEKSSGQSLPMFKRTGSPSILSTSAHNVTRQAVNKLLKMDVHILPAEEDQDGNSVSTGRVIISGLNAVLELKLSESQGGGSSSSAEIAAMQVVSWTSTDDFLLAKIYSFDGGATGSNIKVALPWLLCSAQSPGGDSPQIYPPYAANDIILALDNPDFGTGISGADYLAIQDRNWAQRISYLNVSCAAKHRIVVSGPEIDGA